MSSCPTFHLSGAYVQRPEAETAFGGRRTAGYVFNIQASAPTPELYQADRTWVRNFWEAMRPHAAGGGGYLNFMVESDEARVRATYGEETYERLAHIKAEYDSQNVFHRNVNIAPRPALRTDPASGRAATIRET